MKQVFVKNDRVIVEEVPPPTINDREVLVANAFSAISSGTELTTIKGHKKGSVLNILKNPELRKKALKHLSERGIGRTLETAHQFLKTTMPLGYSSAGYVIAVGRRVTDINVGDRVACAGAGKANHAEIVAVPRNLIAKIPNSVSFAEATFTTLGAIAIQGIRRSNPRFGESIAIIGVGLLGQLGVQIAKAAGLNVIAIDTDEDRVRLAEELGGDFGLIAGKQDIAKEVIRCTNGLGADGVVICAATASSEPVNQAMQMIRKRGRVVVVGAVGMNLERQPFYEKEADLLISRSYGPGRYDSLYEEKGIDYPIGYVRWTENRNMQAFLNLLEQGKVRVNSLAEAVFPIEEAEKAYDLLMRKGKRPLAILLKYNTSEYVPTTGKISLPERVVETSPRVTKGKINVALIGAGNFARDIMLPLLTKIPYYNLRAIVTATGISAEQTALKYNAEYCTTDYKEVLRDEQVDLVIISTRHNLHFPMILDAAKYGKAIYVEKPLCLSEEELNKILKVIQEKKVLLVVGFNRRYSPLSIKAKELLKRKHGPYLILYRVNANFRPKDHWVQDPEIGGGRIIGECCHFFDLFEYFIGSTVERIKAENLPVNNTTVVSNDNVAITTRWNDGSLSILTYTSIGHEDLPKEKIEIFADRSSIIIDDFREMNFYGFKEKKIKLKRQDKGHHQLLVELAKFLKGEESNLVSHQESAKSMRVTFQAHASLLR